MEGGTVFRYLSLSESLHVLIDSLFETYLFQTPSTKYQENLKSELSRKAF